MIHHTASTGGSVESIDASHRRRRDAAGNPWRGIGYHFLIGNGTGMKDGEVAATFRWTDQLAGAHAGDATYNQYGIGICLVGNFETTSPSRAQLESAKALIAGLKSRFGIDADRVVKHGELKATACPGSRLPFRELADAQLQTTEIVNAGGTASTGRRFSAVAPAYMEGIRNVVTHTRQRDGRIDNESPHVEND